MCLDVYACVLQGLLQQVCSIRALWAADIESLNELGELFVTQAEAELS